MRRFNPDKELSKIKNGNKKKTIISICALLLIVAIGSTYALYQVRHSKKLVYTTVKDFGKDVNLAVFINNEKVDEFPNKNEDYIYDKIVCDNNKDNHVTAYWNYDKWALELETSKKAKCNVYFKSGTDRSGANPPELYQGLIPITIEDDGTIKVADLEKEWYNYDDQKWANAIIIDDTTNHSKYYNENGTYKKDTPIPIEDVLQMYVWIPRYKYELFNANNEIVEPQMINVKFENGKRTTGKTKCEIASDGKEICIYDDNKEWYTHPAFTFGNTELSGFWMAKFEVSGTIENINILPEKTSLKPENISIMFTASRNIDKINNKYFLDESEIDTHMVKSQEWGAMSYLTYSKYGRCTEDGNCVEPTINAHNDFVTGYANTNDLWYTSEGVKASTTGNVYGIYDIVGCSCEYVMGIMIGLDGKLSVGNSKFTDTTFPDKKYIDIYSYDDDRLTLERGHLGDATREVWSGNNTSWGGRFMRLVYNLAPYTLKSGFYGDGAATGLFYSFSHQGDQSNSRILDSFRIAMTIQDGDK